MARKRNAKLFASMSRYIDPTDCGSEVGYRIFRTQWGNLQGSIRLTDCSKSCTWELCSTGGGFAKLQEAIDILKLAQSAWVNAVHYEHARLTKAGSKKNLPQV